MIVLQGVGLRHGAPGTPDLLRDISFEVPAGGFRWVLGASGAGKSSLLRLLSLSARPSTGTLRLMGVETGTAARHALPRLRRRIGLIPQDLGLLPHLSVRDNVALPLRLGRGRRADAGDVDDMLRWVGLLRKAGHRPGELSLGEQQRVAIARAVVARPDLLLADEPCSHLDTAQAERVLLLLRELNAAGTTVLVATHEDALPERHPAPAFALAAGRLIVDE